MRDGYTVFYHHVDTLLLELLGRMDEGWKWEDALDISAVAGGGNHLLPVRAQGQ